MRATKETKTNKGITLIALVITIIVMLILVAVTISMAVNGGLFDYAGRAVSETNNALKAEQAIANGGIEVGGVWYNSIDEYLNKDKVETTAIRIDGPSSVEVRQEITLEVYNQANQKVNSEDIEWTIAWEDLGDEGTVATINNGVVKGINLTVGGIFAPINVTVTATYIPDSTIVATKVIRVKEGTCDECLNGIAGYYECPECGEQSKTITEEVLSTEMFCEECNSAYITSSLDKCPECENEDTYYACGPGEANFIFPCGCSVVSGAGDSYSYYTEIGECEFCEGQSTLYY